MDDERMCVAAPLPLGRAAAVAVAAAAVLYGGDGPRCRGWRAVRPVRRGPYQPAVPAFGLSADQGRGGRIRRHLAAPGRGAAGSLCLGSGTGGHAAGLFARSLAQLCLFESPVRCGCGHGPPGPGRDVPAGAQGADERGRRAGAGRRGWPPARGRAAAAGAQALAGLGRRFFVAPHRRRAAPEPALLWYRHRFEPAAGAVLALGQDGAPSPAAVLRQRDRPGLRGRGLHLGRQMARI